MELKTKKINKNTYTLILSSKSNYYGFKHLITIFKNNYKMIDNSIQYYNRTWECWEYQTIILNTIYKLIENKKEQLKNNYKNNNNIYRLTDKTKKELEKIYKNDVELKELDKLYKHYKENRY